MSRFFPRARSWVLVALPAALALAGCDEAPTESSPPAILEGVGGKVVYEKIAFSSNQGGRLSIYVRDLDGFDIDKRVTNPPDGYADSEPDFAPGNRALVFTRWHSGDSELFSVGLNGRPLKQLTSFGAMVQNPVYSPDGSRIAFISDTNGSLDVYVMDANGSNVQRVTATTAGDYHPTWPDGSKLAYTSNDLGQGTRIWARNTATWSAEILLECPDSWCTNPTWARNSNRIMYEYSELQYGSPALKLLDLDTNVDLLIPGYPSGRVGGWKPSGTRFIFWSGSPAVLYAADTGTLESGAFYPFPTPAGITVWPTWSR
jgi:Tol biopolymer transport system component